MNKFFCLKLIILFLSIFFDGSANLPVQLTQLKNNLAGLQGKLCSLKGALHDLGDELSYESPKSLNALLPSKFYGKEAQTTYNEIQQRILNNAEIEEYGYKAANLMELVKLCALVNKALRALGIVTTYRFAVPEFFCISSSEIQRFLALRGIDLAVRWKSIVGAHFSDKQKLKKAIETKKYPEEFLAQAQRLENDIHQKFQAIVANISAQPAVNDFTNLGIQCWGNVQAVVNYPDVRCMVRSSGREDTDKLANAGGNESISNVIPTSAGLMRAIGQVVASYFSQKSLMQRLWAGDYSIVDKPFSPILVQRMIGEQPGKQLPRCGVMFTEEPEGALSKRFLKNGNNFIDVKGAPVSEEDVYEKARYRDENHKIITSGISIIQAALGHNEGVVNSLIPVDSYFAYDNETIFPLILEKYFRLAPQAEGVLQKVENDSSVVRKPALTGHVARLLKHLANALEDYYKKPMDVEFVILKEEKGRSINIVQARPIVHNLHQPEPTYLDLEHSDVKDHSIIFGQAVGSGGGSVRYAEKNDELVVTKGIGEALLTYQMSRDPQGVKAILINEMAPATSHEATTFRSELKPVICFEKDFETIEQWSRQALANILLDAQQQCVLQWPQDKIFDFEDLVKSNVIKNGWINYPLPQQFSVLIDYLPATFDEKYSELNQYFFKSNDIAEKQRSDYWAFLKKQPSFLGYVKSQIMRIKTGNQQDAKAALADIWLLVNSVSVRTGYEKRVQALIHFTGVIISNLLPNLGILQDDDEYLSKRLFPIHVLEALLLQQHKDEIGLFCNSVIKLWHQQEEESLGAKTVASKDSYAKIAGMLQKYALTDDLKKKWSAFIDDFDKRGRSMQNIFEAMQTDKASVLSADEKIKAKFYSTLKELGDLDMLELWLNTSFANNQNIEQLVQEINEAQKFLRTLLDYKKKIASINLAGFESPATFLKNWNDFQKNTLAYFIGDKPNDFVKTFIGYQTNNLGRLAALGVMEQLIAQFDTAIKAVTGSTQFGVTKLPDGKSFDEVNNNPVLLKEQIVSKKDKLFAFHLMLEKYFELLQKWYQLSLNCGISWVEYNRDGPPIASVLEKEISKLLEDLKKETGNHAQLQSPVPAAGAAVGTSVAFGERLAPRTLEGVFMFVHQSLLNVITNLMGKYGIKVAHMPPDVQQINQAVLKINYGGAKTSLVGATLQGQLISLMYNLPQRLHSAIINVVYNTKTKQATVSLNMFGADHFARWERGIDFIEYNNVVRSKKNLAAKTIFLSRGFESSWPLDKNDPGADISSNIGPMVEILCWMADQNNVNIYRLKNGLQINPFQAAEMLAHYNRIDENFFCSICAKTDHTEPLKDLCEYFANMVLILEKLLDSGSDFLLETGVFLVKKEFKAADFHEQHSEAQIFYRVNKDNFFDLVGTFKAYNLFDNEINRLKKSIELLLPKITDDLKKKYVEILKLEKKEIAPKIGPMTIVDEKFVLQVIDACFHRDYRTSEKAQAVLADLQKDEALKSIFSRLDKKMKNLDSFLLKRFINRIMNDDTDGSLKSAISQLEKISKVDLKNVVTLLTDSTLIEKNKNKISKIVFDLKVIQANFKATALDQSLMSSLNEIIREFCRHRIQDDYYKFKEPLLLSIFYYATILRELFADEQELCAFVDGQLVGKILRGFESSMFLRRGSLFNAMLEDAVFLACCKKYWQNAVARDLSKKSENIRNDYVSRVEYTKLSIPIKLLLAPIFIKAQIWNKAFLLEAFNLAKEEIKKKKTKGYDLASDVIDALDDALFLMPSDVKLPTTRKQLKDMK